MALYRAYGLTIDSDISITSLRLPPDSEEPDVQVRKSLLPDVPAPDAPRPQAVKREDGLYFTWPDVGTYRVEGSGCIVCDPNLEVDRRYALQPVLGVLLGVVLHLRGLYTLHASAAVVGKKASGESQAGGRAVAFTGWKGQGKSTTAAAFREAGFPVLTDDVLAIDCFPEPEARRSFPRLKLRPDAAEELEYDWEDLSGLGGPLSKRAWTGEDGFCDQPHSLSAVFRLAEGEGVSCEELSKRRAVQTLLEQSYAPRFLNDDLVGTRHFEQCAHVARHVPVYVLRRPRRLDVLPDLIETVTKTVIGSSSL